MPSYVTPQRGAAFVFHTALTSQADTMLQQVNPTLAAGDCQVSKDAGAFANLTTLPDVQPAGGASVRVQLSAAEMTADNVVVRFSDAAGAEWCDQMILIQTAAQQIDDLAATGAKMDLVDTPNPTALAAFAAAIGSVWDALVSALNVPGTIGQFILTKLGLLQPGEAPTLTSPVTSFGIINTICGDSYLLADGRALIWTINTSIDLPKATLSVVIQDGPIFSAMALDNKTICVELTSLQSANIPSRPRMSYEIIATAPNKATLVRGTWNSSPPFVSGGLL